MMEVAVMHRRADCRLAPDRGLDRRSFLQRSIGAIAILPAGLAGLRAAQAGPTQTGTVRIEQVQLAFIGSANPGGGTLAFGGRNYNFSVGGLGIGGFGISKMVAIGEVYDLKNVTDFPGAYLQARYGLAVGQLSTGDLWLQNTNGVGLRLSAERTGLALSLGGDAVYIGMD